MSEPCETPEKADSESRCSTPRASSIISLDFDESSKSERHSRARSSRSSTPVTKSLRPRVKVSESPGSIHGEKYDDDDDSSMDEGPLVEKRKSIGPGEKLHDAYCWICHKELSTEGNSKECSTCVRSLHPKCIPSARPGQTPVESDKWECPECAPFVYEVPPRSGGTQEQLNVLFRYLIDRAVGHTAEPFMNPVDLKEFPQYMDYIIHPVCISQIEDKLSKEEYYSARELLTDFKWIYHNSVIFNSSQAKLTSIAKQMLRLAREEAKEIENCPNCLYNAYSAKPDWFIQACDRPHLLVWAKMKGFPYWPAKAMAFNQNQSMVDVRFFGKHDRAYLPIVDCMLYTSWYPAPAQVKKPREDVAACIKEVDQHIEKLKERFGMFVYASNITFLNPKDMEGQVKKMLPNYKPEDHGKKHSLPITDQPGLTALKPSVVLTRLIDFESKVPSPLGSPQPAAAKSDTSSRKNSVDESSYTAPLINLDSSPEKSKDAISPNVVLTPARATTSALPSSKVPLKRKIGPASKVGGQRATLKSNKGSVETISLDNRDETDEMTHELEALESVLNDSEDDIDNYIEDDIIDVPPKKVKQDSIEKNVKAGSVVEKSAPAVETPTSEMSSTNNEAQQKDSKATKPTANKERQRKIAEGIKALDNLKIYGLDVVPVPVDASSAPMSPSIADMSSDSSEFIESDIEMEKDSFKLERKIEKVEVMEVEPDLSLPLIQRKPKPAPKSASKKPPAKAANKEVNKKVPPHAVLSSVLPAPSYAVGAAPKLTGQSILKSNNMPNKARKTLTTSSTSILSQRLAKPTPAAKRAATIAQKKQIIVTQTVCAPKIEPLKLNVNVPPPDSAGPAVTMLNATAEKLADFMKQSVYSLVSDIAKNSEEDLKTENAVLKLQIELMKWQQTQAITEVARNHEISLQELDVLVEENALRARLECQRIASEEMRKAVTEAKRKTWCAVCLLEASLYCCWNTSYCSVSCQKKHWLEHKSSCKLKTSNVHPIKPDGPSFLNGPSPKSVMYVATSMAQSNGTVVQTSSGKKTMPQTLPAHAVFGTSAEITAALPQLLAVAPSQGGEKSESGHRPATHFLMTPASSQVKLPAAIHHTSLPPTISGRSGQTVAKTSNAQVTNTPLFQFYKENTE